MLVAISAVFRIFLIPQDFIAYSELVKLRLEDGIDPTRKEEYLNDEEFVKVCCHACI
jgi:hypothetical protein